MSPLAVDTREVYDDLAGVYVPIAVAAFAVVVVALVWAVARRGRGGRDEHPGELLIALGLAAVTAVLLVATFRATDRESARAAAPGEVVDVTAAKWGWTFTYPRHDITVTGDEHSPALLTVPAGVEIEFRATSEDVIHGFWIPDLKFQRQLIPRQTVRFDLTFPRPGVLSNGACSFFCGLEHAQMRFAIDVRPPRDYASWVASQ